MQNKPQNHITMKKVGVFLLVVFLSLGIGLRAQGTSDIVIDDIVFANHEEYTSVIKTLPKASRLTSPLVFEIDGYRFSFSKNNNDGGIMLDYTGRLMVLPQSLIQIERLDGNALRSIFITVSISATPADIAGYTPITYFRGSVDGTEVQTWYNKIQFNSTSLTIRALPSNNNKGTCYYFTGITIGRDAGTPEAQMQMELSITEATAIGSRTAIVDFTLGVANDDGIRDFTITATDEEGEEHGSRTFTRQEIEEESQAMVEDSEASDDNGNYTLSGKMKLSNLKKNERQNLTFAVTANYDDRESIPCTTTPVYEVNTIGATGIEDTSVENNEPAEYFNLQGMKVTAPHGGIFIVKRGNIATRAYIH